MSGEQITLTISILISRREEQVRRCLESLAPLRKAVSCELILVDTSEDPHIRQIIQGYTDPERILSFHWINDFAAARNAGLRAARGEWFLYLDDDEWFTDLREIVNFFLSGRYREYNGANYLVRNYLNLEGTRWNDMWVSRMAKIQPQMHFTSIIHEYLVPLPDKCIGLHSVADHYGYASVSEEDQRRRYERNHPLIMEMMKREPNEVRWRSMALMDYWNVGEMEELFRFARDSLRFYEGNRDPMVSNVIGSFYAAKLLVYEEWLRYDMAHTVCREALEDIRLSRLGRAYFRNWRAKYLLEEGQYQQAMEDAQYYLDNYDYFQGGDVEQILQLSAAFLMNAYDAQYIILAYSILICAGLREGNVSYLKQHFSKLKIEEGPVYIYPKLPETVIGAMTTMNEKKIFVRVLRGFYNKEEIWQQFEVALLEYVAQHVDACEKLSALLEMADIDNSFLKLYGLKNRLCNPEEGLRGEKLESVLESYIRVGIPYYESILESTNDDIGKLPADYRGILRLRDILEEEDRRRRVSMLKDVVEIYPPLSESMKRYAVYLGELLAEHSAYEPEPSSELEEMARQIIPNVRMMMDQGMYEEASAVLSQLRGMLPDNTEILELEKQMKSE